MKPIFSRNKILVLFPAFYGISEKKGEKSERADWREKGLILKGIMT